MTSCGVDRLPQGLKPQCVAGLTAPFGFAQGGLNSCKSCPSRSLYDSLYDDNLIQSLPAAVSGCYVFATAFARARGNPAGLSFRISSKEEIDAC
jgi:hypothetical protein